ncbi:iron(III) transport system substrate-binding protein [Allopseudospirillum japonicum]|uniref:Iron(III) transport system substrate-binding protein n=1 Tax=Allopseudospirillum japonicum TaxID=64971 RepID=A0A1H6SV11_9GAMM|nr:Fe(3+) ABC transporter substrate-binding protein [Allopseudospirillum japonicum]SEI71601.1 iron(III) transport system substrate-binding protein [Allopseudospirillum japonicum]
MLKPSLLATSLLAASSLFSTSYVLAQDEVNVYSYRQAFLVEPLFAEFTKQTGVKVNVVFAKAGLIERLEQEGKHTPADLLLTTDIGHLEEAMEKGVLQPVQDEVLEEHIPAHLRDPEGRWFALTTRARVIYASKERVPEGEVQSYEDLADPKWQGRICTRKGDHPYNIALIASMIAHHGEEDAKAWLSALKSNLAQKPQGNDRAQVKAIKEGVCDLAIGNSYYYGKMLENPEQQAWAQAVNLVYPNQQDRGTHMNISGVGMTLGAPHKEAALQLMRFLSDTKAQGMYAEVNYETPVKADVPASELVASWGEFKADTLPLHEIAAQRKAAAQLVNKVEFNH